MRAGDSQKSTALPSSHVLVSVLSVKSKWTYLAKYWLGLHLRKYELSFANLSIPHAEQVSHYYKYVLSMFRKFKALTPNFIGRQLITT